jgi:hypothetical protein
MLSLHLINPRVLPSAEASSSTKFFCRYKSIKVVRQIYGLFRQKANASPSPTRYST